MYDLQNIVTALKMSQHDKQGEVLCKLWGGGGGVSKGNGETLKGKKEVPNLSAIEAAEAWETQEIKSGSYFLLSII